MVDPVSAAVGAVVLLLLLLAIYHGIRLLPWFGSNGEDPETTDERLEMAGTERHHRVGFRDRYSQQLPPVKAFILAVGVFVVWASYYAYQIAATGSPSQAAYAGYVDWGVFGMVCMAGGIWFYKKQRQKAGKLSITRETEEGNHPETYWFDWNRTRPTDEGTVLVPELKSNRLFGLFWRPKLIADDPDRRDADHRLPSDRVVYEVPTDDSAVWNEEEQEVRVRSKRIREVENPNRPVDYEIVPSDRKSKSEIQDLQDEIRELEGELTSEKRMVALLTEQLEEVEAILENEEHAGTRKIREAIDTVDPLLPHAPRRRENGVTGDDDGSSALSTPTDD